MKLEVGMYVRDTRNGEIYQLNEFSLNFRSQKYTYDFEKASFDIIDLIEVGDYVNGYEITFVKEKDVCGDEELDYQHIYYGNFGSLIEIRYYEIKSILTHEQFEQMEYKIGE